MHYLSDTSRAIYLALAGKTPLSISDIARTAKLHRPAVYTALADMEKDGLVLQQKDGKRVLYTLQAEEKLRTIFTVKLQEQEADIQTLLQLVTPTQGMQEIHGKEEIIQLYDDLVTGLGEQENYYSFTTTTKNIDIVSYLPKHFRKVRESKNLWSHVISDKPTDMKKGVRFSLEIKQIHPDAPLPQNCLWLVYGDTFVFIDMEKESGYKITNKKLATFQAGILHHLYKTIPNKVKTDHNK